MIQNWGLADSALNIPTNGSIALTLDGLSVTTSVKWRVDLMRDRITINTRDSSVSRLDDRISAHLDQIRRLTAQESRAEVVARSNFQPHTGVSLYGPLFASLTLAAATAAGHNLSLRELTSLARLGAGSACLSIPGGYVEWRAGHNHDSSHARSIAPAEHWPLVDLIAVVSSAGTQIDSLDQHHSVASTSPLQTTRIMGADARLLACSEAILTKDFEALAAVVEMDSRLIRAVTLTATPSQYYWAPSTLTIIDRVRAWRTTGLSVFYCIAPGPNVHCVCEPEDADLIEQQLHSVPGILDVRRAGVGGPARVLER